MDQIDPYFKQSYQPAPLASSPKTQATPDDSRRRDLDLLLGGLTGVLQGAGTPALQRSGSATAGATQFISNLQQNRAQEEELQREAIQQEASRQDALQKMQMEFENRMELEKFSQEEARARLMQQLESGRDIEDLRYKRDLDLSNVGYRRDLDASDVEANRREKERALDYQRDIEKIRLKNALKQEQEEIEATRVQGMESALEPERSFPFAKQDKFFEWAKDRKFEGSLESIVEKSYKKGDPSDIAWTREAYKRYNGIDLDQVDNDLSLAIGGLMSGDLSEEDQRKAHAAIAVILKSISYDKVRKIVNPDVRDLIIQYEQDYPSEEEIKRRKAEEKRAEKIKEIVPELGKRYGEKYR